MISIFFLNRTYQKRELKKNDIRYLKVLKTLWLIHTMRFLHTQTFSKTFKHHNILNNYIYTKEKYSCPKTTIF